MHIYFSLPLGIKLIQHIPFFSFYILCFSVILLHFFFYIYIFALYIKLCFEHEEFAVETAAESQTRPAHKDHDYSTQLFA